jgi:hypothetical protein
MEKVYQINMYEEEEYNSFECTTLGIFTDQEVAEGIISKFLLDKKNRLEFLWAEIDKFDEAYSIVPDEEKPFYKNPNWKYSNAIHREQENLERISYSIQEIIINQLIK